ncbi:PASTA domain-containing protein [Saccharothrix syringae]|uniref:PASTA domain-containing protein n=1 Tax=Saccharothrix syringae TaxID=103733 RepID=UPI000ADDC39E|nr:PASTA domain-containing protein [Saccharothrix syringae]
MKTRLAVLLGTAALLTACSPTTGQTGGTTAPITTREDIPAPAPVPTTAEAPPPPAPETCTVPNVVGLVHQTAQDTMQAAGLYMLREEDATGRGRLLVVDRNWTTTAQSVAAGEVVDCDTTITLSAKKIGE